jgi:hypothetical protein
MPPERSTKAGRRETLGPQIQAMLANDPSATPPERELMYELHDVIN